MKLAWRAAGVKGKIRAARNRPPARMGPMRPRIFAVAAVLALAACSGGAPRAATTTGRPPARRIVGVPGLDNFARIDERLYRGAQPTPEGYRKLKEMGVKTVINFRSHHSYKKEIEALGMTCVELPLRADAVGSEPPTEEQLKKFFEVVLDPARQPVFMHCAGGKDRTGTLSSVYRIEVDGWSNDEAVEEMKSFGFHEVYTELMNYVKSYKPRGFGPGR